MGACCRLSIRRKGDEAERAVMKNAIKAILVFIGTAIAIIFGLRSKLHDNGARADSIRNGLGDSAKRAEDLASGIKDATSDIKQTGQLNTDARDSARKSIDALKTADDAISGAIDVISKIRKRGPIDSSRANSGNSSD